MLSFFLIKKLRKCKSTLIEGDPNAPFSIALSILLGVGKGAALFPGLLHLTFDPYLIVLSAKQGGIKYRL